MIREAISLLEKKENLTPEVMELVMDEIMTGAATDAQKGAFLTALAMKGETIEEITAAARIMRKHCAPFQTKGPVMEIVGTGGDKSNSFNISTLASIVVSAAGVPVAKHGNRAASSKCGTADCLEALGVKIDLETEKCEKVLNDLNLCFLFAQKYHPAMRFVGSVRKELGIRTLFNILGPLANPAHAGKQLLGVYSEELVEPLAHVLSNLGVTDALVVYGCDCLDEISLSAPTKVCEMRNGLFQTYEITPEQFGFTPCRKEDLTGGTPEENAAIAKSILSGEKSARTDAVLLNGGAALYTAGKCASIEEGIGLARETITSGKAIKQLETFIHATCA